MFGSGSSGGGPPLHRRAPARHDSNELKGAVEQVVGNLECWESLKCISIHRDGWIEEVWEN
eukprot:5404574-Lingulodinium_polyedra.AAC.1